MKIGNYDINFPFFQEKVLEADTARSLWGKPGANVVTYDCKSVKNYYAAYLDDDKVRGMVDDLIEAALGNGYYTTVEEVTKIKRTSKTKDLCDAFGEHFQLDDLKPNIGRNVAIAGFCPVETILQKGASWDDFSKMSLTIIRPDTIDPKKGIEVDKTTRQIVKIYQDVDGKKGEIKVGGDLRIVNFNYGQLGNDARGVSFVRGMINLLNMLNDATNNVNDILKRYLAPLGIWRNRKSIELIKKMATKRKPGEDIFLGNLTESEMKEKIVEFVSIDPRVPFWTFLEYLDRRIWSYSRSNDLWYVRNATEASANKLDDIVGRHVTSFQRSLKRGTENGWFKPIVEMWFQGKEVPKIEYGAEKTGVEDVQIGPFITAGVEVGYITQPQFQYLLKQMGLDLDQAPSEEEKPEDEEQDTDDLPPEELDKQPNQKDMKPPKPGQPEHLHKAERIYVFDLCMDCDSAPTNEVLWLDSRGTGHAWFCDEHYKKFVNDSRHIILFSRPISGKATVNWAVEYTRRSGLTT